MLLDPNTTTEALLFMNRFQILVVKEEKKRKDILCLDDVDVTLPLLLQYSSLHTRNSINVKWWWWQWNDEEQHYILEFRIARGLIYSINIYCQPSVHYWEYKDGVATLWTCVPPGKWGLFSESLTCELRYPWWDWFISLDLFCFKRIWVERGSGCPIVRQELRGV